MIANTNVSTCTTLGAANTNYDLTTNLTTSTNCMFVSAANIIFDCKGYSITGDGSVADTAIGIGQTVALNFTAKNCIINSFGTGIKTISASNTFTNNTINKTSWASSAAIYVLNGASPVITNNIIDNYNGSAILLDNADNPTVSGNTIINQGASFAEADGGVSFSGTMNPQFTSNTITNCLHDALYFSDNAGGTAETYANNNFTNITGYAFYFAASIQAKTIANNTVTNATSGFLLFTSYGVSATRTITNNTYDGVNANITFTINPTYADIFYWYPTPTSLPADPTNVKNISKYFNMTITGTGGTPKIGAVNVTYSDSNIINIAESSLQMYRWNGTAWSNSTLGATQNEVYATNNYVAVANITNLSLFGIFGQGDTSPNVISSRISPTTAYVNSTLLGYCNATDNENTTIRYYYRWFLNNIVNATGTSVNATNATEINVANITSGLVKSQNWTLECIANDFTYNSTALNSSQLTISNSAPTMASQISFANSSTDHSFTATAGITDIDGASDIQSTNASSTIGTCVYLSNSTSGNDFNVTYNCTATYSGTSSVRLGFTDKGSAYIGTNLANNAYPDQSPTLGAPSITPNPAYKNNTALTCNNGSWSDPDGDSENTTARTWRWFRNTTVISAQTAQTLGNSFYNKTDILICEETAFANNWTTSTAKTNSSQITISNSAPVNLSISLITNATAGHWFTFRAIADDADGWGDFIDWFPTPLGECVQYALSQIGNRLTTDVNCTAPSMPRSILFNESFNDTDNNMTTATYNNTYPNQLPVTVAPTLSPIPAYKNDSQITCTNGTTIDADADISSFTYLWYLNGTTTGITNQNITNVSYDETDELICQITPSDGIANGTAKNSTTLTISGYANTNPTMNNSRIYPAVNASHNAILEGYCNASDAESTTFTYYWNWYVNGTFYGAGSISAPNATETNVENISASVTTPGQNWTLECLATDTELNSTKMNSTVTLITNDAPITGTPTLSPTPAYKNVLNTTVTCTNSTTTDADGDSVSFYYLWYKNATSTGITTQTITNASFTYADVLICEITPYDGIENGTKQNSSALTILTYNNMTATPIQNGNATYGQNIRWNYTATITENGTCVYTILAAYWSNFNANSIVVFDGANSNIGVNNNARTIQWMCNVSQSPFNITFNTTNPISFANSSWSQNTTAETNVSRQHIYYNITAINTGNFAILNADFPTACYDANTTCTIQNTTNLTALQTLIVRQYGYGDYIAETTAPLNITQDVSMQPFIYAANTTLYINSTLIANNTINLSLNSVTWNFSYTNITCYDSAQCNFLQNFTANENKSRNLKVSTNLSITESTLTIPTNPFLYGDGIWTNVSDDLNLTVSSIKFARAVPAAPYFAFFVCAGGTCTSSSSTGWSSTTASVVSGEIRRDAGDTLSSVSYMIPYALSAGGGGGGGGGGTITVPGANETPELCGAQRYITCVGTSQPCACFEGGVWVCPTCYGLTENTFGGGGGFSLGGTNLTGAIENLTGGAISQTNFVCQMILAPDFPLLPIEVRAFINKENCEIQALLRMTVDAIKLPLGVLFFIVTLLLALYYYGKTEKKWTFRFLVMVTLTIGIYSFGLIISYAQLFLGGG